MRRTPAISRPWRGVRRGLVLGLDRFPRAVREREEAARRAPLAERELRVVVRRILQASGRRRFYTPPSQVLTNPPPGRAGCATASPASGEGERSGYSPDLAILSTWLSIRSAKRSCVIGTWSKSAGWGRSRRGRSASPCATSPCWMARDGAGCSALKTASGTAESVSAGCKLTLLDVWFARRADTTTWEGTASASSAASASTVKRRAGLRFWGRDKKPQADHETPEQHEIERNRQPLAR